MKPNQKSLLSSLALGTALILSATSGAQAAVTITVAPSGPNVVATGSGTINLSALTLLTSVTGESAVIGSQAAILIGSPSAISVYQPNTGSPNFGGGSQSQASTGSGDLFGVAGGFGLYVPQGYVSNAPLSGTATWNNKTISSLGLTPGTYVYNWGSGGTADSFTVQIVPEPSHALLSLGSLGTLALRRRR